MYRPVDVYMQLQDWCNDMPWLCLKAQARMQGRDQGSGSPPSLAAEIYFLYRNKKFSPVMADNTSLLLLSCNLMPIRHQHCERVLPSFPPRSMMSLPIPAVCASSSTSSNHLTWPSSSPFATNQFRAPMQQQSLGESVLVHADNMTVYHRRRLTLSKSEAAGWLVRLRMSVLLTWWDHLTRRMRRRQWR
jgi:hypothetical protein